MGRKKKTPVGVFDRIGERITPEKCPECQAHPDCFANINGLCTALKQCDGQSCVFYKESHVAMQEVKQSYQKLKAEHRFDLLEKYHKPLYALGVVEEELTEELTAPGEKMDIGERVPKDG